MPLRRKRSCGNSPLETRSVTIFGVNVRTAQKWERDRLPVFRTSGVCSRECRGHEARYGTSREQGAKAAHCLVGGVVGLPRLTSFENTSGLITVGETEREHEEHGSRPETSSEERKRLLDRALLIGKPGEPDMGFFSTLI